MKISINYICTLFILITISNLKAQSHYYTKDGQKHLLDRIELADLESQEFNDWYISGKNKYSPELKFDIKSNLENIKVKVFMATWCGDTKFLLPRFVKLWEEAGLQTSQLEIIALHREGDEYKRSPARDEENYNIHRVPTFIFEKEGKEIGRIVEKPINDLETDITQIAFGIPSKPRYRGASTLYEYFKKHPLDSLTVYISDILNPVYENISTAAELNTMGYVLKAAGRFNEAEMAFILNTRMFKYDPNVFDSLGELYLEMDKSEDASACFEQVLAIDRNNERAKNMLKELKDKIEKL